MSMDLFSLRNRLKRDPPSYYEEFKQQFRHFQANLQIFQIQTDGTTGSRRSKEAKQFAELVEFMAHVCSSYPKDCQHVPKQLLELVANHVESLDPQLRKTLVQALIMLCNRDLISRLDVLPVFFKLFRCADKQLRQLLFSHIVNDLKRVNLRSHNQKLNSALQNFMFTMVRDENVVAAKKSLDVMVELWRRSVWRSDKTVTVIMNCCFSKDSSILQTALRFFLGVEDVEDEDEGKVDNPSLAIKETAMGAATITHTKRRKKRTRQVQRTMARLKRQQQELQDEDFSPTTKSHSSVANKLSYSALEMVHDPQSFADRLFSQLRNSNHAFDIRMLMMNVISRLVGSQQLVLFNFYPFLQKYMQPKQRHVTNILTFVAQASHDLVPPDILLPVVKTLANNFVSDRSSPEVMAVGLNAIREVCARCPLVMTRELLQDLAQYKGSKQKGVMMAARSLIALYREVNPELLARKDRGKEAGLNILEAKRTGSAVQGTAEYGAMKVVCDVEGAELLMQETGEDGASDSDEWNVPVHDSDSDSDGDGDGGDHIHEEGTEEAPAPMDEEPEHEQEKEEKIPFAAVRFLTPKDFERLKLIKKRDPLRRGTKRRREDGSTLASRMSDVVSTEDIIGYVKKQKLDKEARMASVMEGRMGRDKFGRPKEKGGGTTNKEKTRLKPFMMVKQSRSVAGKANQKFSLKVKRMGAHVKRIKRMAKHKKKRQRRT